MLLLLSCVSSWDAYGIRVIEEQKHRIQTQKNIDFITNYDPSIERKGCAAFHSRRESISVKIPTSFFEDKSMPYSGFETEPTRLQAEYHDHLLAGRH
ncbi:hypothetical protein TNCV_2662921 [Trichonephila clavipes]|nr:hypothetical protein TNCV_2662921 [Trichonephila clavipes]